MAIIRRFVKHVPGFVDYDTREAAEAQLAALACGLAPEELRAAADRLAVLLDQDGELSDADRAQRCQQSPGGKQLIQYTKRHDALTFAVRVVPRAAQSCIVGEHDGALRVRIAAPPVEGAANEELIRTLARALGVPVRDVEITRGHAAKLKQVCVRGAEVARLESLAAKQ